MAEFIPHNNGCKAPCEVVFTSTSRHATTYLWEFGDGQTSTEANPRHTYSKVGQYEVKLMVQGAGGSHQATQRVKINTLGKVWDKSFGGGLSEHLQSMVSTLDGGYLLGGLSYAGNEENYSEVDYHLVKIGADGAQQWEKTYAGNFDDWLSSLIATADGGFLLGGYSNSRISGDKSQDNNGGLDYWIIKIGADGAKQWDRTYGGTGYDGLSSMIATADGGFLLGGYSDSPASGDKSLDSKGKSDCWIIKIGAGGAKQWDRTYGGTGYDGVSSMIATADGGFLLGGYSDSPASGDKSLDSKGKSDYWIIKIGAGGAKQWDRTYGGTGYDGVSSMIATADGGFLLGGISDSPASGDKSQDNKGGNDYWIIKIGTDGTKQWDKTYGGQESDGLISIKVAPGGGFLLGGNSFSNASADKSENVKGASDYWIVKISADGNLQWDHTLGGNRDDYLTSLVATPDGGYLLGGRSMSKTSGDKSEDTRGESDLWVIKLK